MYSVSVRNLARCFIACFCHLEGKSKQLLNCYDLYYELNRARILGFKLNIHQIQKDAMGKIQSVGKLQIPPSMCNSLIYEVCHVLIFSFLEPLDLIKISVTSRNFYNIAAEALHNHFQKPARFFSIYNLNLFPLNFGNKYLQYKITTEQLKALFSTRKRKGKWDEITSKRQRKF